MISSAWRRGIAVAIVVGLCSVVVGADGDVGGDYAIGHLAGKSDARGNAFWIVPGCLCSILAPIVAVFIKPAPPASELVGKSAEYVLGYTDSYKKAARWKNVGWASLGCVGSGVIGLILAVAGAAS